MQKKRGDEEALVVQVVNHRISQPRKSTVQVQVLSLYGSSKREREE